MGNTCYADLQRRVGVQSKSDSHCPVDGAVFDSANWLCGFQRMKATRRTVKLDDHSEVVPLLPIPNRTVKRLSADDSAGSRVKVGHYQAINKESPRLMTRAFFRSAPSIGLIVTVRIRRDLT